MNAHAIDPFPHLPLFLDLSGRVCLLLGGDASGAAKARALVKAGARVTVIAPEISPELARVVKEHRLRWKAKPFRGRMLTGVWLVVSSLTDERQNARLYRLTQRRGIFLNVVDRPRFCSAYWPARVDRPPVVAAISTGGMSPALASYVRRQLEQALSERLGEFASWLSQRRRDVAGKLPDLEARGKFWREALDVGVAERFLAGDAEGADVLLRAALESVIDRR